MTSSALESIVVSSGYFERVGEAICRIALARSEAETSHLLREATQHLGADVAVFCSFVRDAPG
jgi:hypothetical protein